MTPGDDGEGYFVLGRLISLGRVSFVSLLEQRKSSDSFTFGGQLAATRVTRRVSQVQKPLCYNSHQMTNIITAQAD